MYRRLPCLKAHVLYSCTPTDSASHFLIGKRERRVHGQDTRSGADVILHKKSSMLPAISAVRTSKLRRNCEPDIRFAHSISSKSSGRKPAELLCMRKNNGSECRVLRQAEETCVCVMG